MPDDSPVISRGQRLPRSERRAQLLDAALGVFVENGYHQAAMDDIAASAGVSKPVLYQHFPGKLELYLALIDQHSNELEKLVRDALALQDNKSRINTLVNAFFDFVAQEGAAFRLIFESDLANEPEVRKRLDQVDLTCAEAMADIIRSETSLGQDEAIFVGVGLVGLAQTSARHWLTHEATLSKETAIRVTGALIRRGFGGFPALGVPRTQGERPATGEDSPGNPSHPPLVKVTTGRAPRPGRRRKRFDVEVRIGVQHVAREISFETTMTADELIAAVKAARTSDVLELTDDKGGRIVVPTDSLGYVTTGAEKKSGVGFGAH